jgi:hypothetical protein
MSDAHDLAFERAARALVDCAHTMNQERGEYCAFCGAKRTRLGLTPAGQAAGWFGPWVRPDGIREMFEACLSGSYSVLGLAARTVPPTYAALYSGAWEHPASQPKSPQLSLAVT